MNVLRDATSSNPWKVVVDHMHDIGDVQATGGYSSSNHDWALGRLEGTTSYLVSNRV